MEKYEIHVHDPDTKKIYRLTLDITDPNEPIINASRLEDLSKEIPVDIFSWKKITK